MKASVVLYSEQEKAGMVIDTLDLEALLKEIREEPKGWEVVAVKVVGKEKLGPEYARVMGHAGDQTPRP